jgi:hypothetical protein
VSASAQGKKDWLVTVEVPAKPGPQTITVPRLEDAPIVATPAAPSHEATPGPTAPSQEDPGHTQRLVALGVGGAGIVGLVVGGLFGLSAKSKLDDSNASNHCDAANTCDATGLGLRSDAKSAALVSTIGFVVGTAAVAGGAVLWFTAPRQAREAPARVGLAPDTRGLSLVGIW